MPMTDAVSGRKGRRREAPKHITLPATLHLERTNGSNTPFSHIFPATPAARSSLSPGAELRPNQNPFFILGEEEPPVLTQSTPPSSTPKLTRRPALPVKISLEHAFGDTRTKRDPDQPASHPPPTPAKAKEISIPSPILSRSTSRVSVVSQPELSTKPKKSRPRSRTVASDQAIRWSLDTPSFRSAACILPCSGTPRDLSISDVPVSGHLGRAVDIFGLAAVQPPRIPARPRRRMRHKSTEEYPLSATPNDNSSTIIPLDRVVDTLAVSARTASVASS